MYHIAQAKNYVYSLFFSQKVLIFFLCLQEKYVMLSRGIVSNSQMIPMSIHKSVLHINPRHAE